MQNVHIVHMSLFRDAIFMMQMSHVRMKMQNLSMMMPVHIFKSRCKCFLAEVEVQKFHGANAFLWVCYDANAPLWVCHDANAPCRYAMI